MFSLERIHGVNIFKVRNLTQIRINIETRCVCDYRRNLSIGEDPELISEDSLKAVEELVSLLKGYAHSYWIFRPRLHVNSYTVEDKVNQALKKGRKRILHRLVTRDHAIEGVYGLQTFLMNLGQPIIPQFVQALALDESKGVNPEIIAIDMLGLMNQNLPSRHLRLVTTILDLLHCAVKNTHTDELRGSAVPLSMLPILFQIESYSVPRWRKLIAIVMEMIRLAPSQLNMVMPNPQQEQRISVIA